MENVPFVINGLPHERPTSICLMTFKKSCIPNLQFTCMTEQDIHVERLTESQYCSTFKGSETKMYNCHGMTFACRRTGIYEDHAINTILEEEYREIKSLAEVTSGDVVVYYKDGIIEHSATVVQTISNLGLNSIKVLSKTHSYKEIEHFVQFHPYIGSEIKYFRINHAAPTIIS